MNYRVTFLMVLFMLAITSVHSQQLKKNQTLLDSLEAVLSSEISETDRATTLYELGKYHQYLDSAKAIDIFEELLPLAEKLQNRRLMADVYYLKAGIFRRYVSRQLSLNY